jgi:hypothetical protein
MFQIKFTYRNNPYTRNYATYQIFVLRGTLKTVHKLKFELRLEIL